VAADERRDAEEARRTEKRMRRKAVWVVKREVRAAAAKRKREVAREGGPTRGVKAGAKENEVEAVDDTLLGRVAALERKLEEQVRGEKKRVEEAFGEGMEVQGRKILLIVEEIRGRNEERERKLTWELEEERRKNRKEEKSRRGIHVKDRLLRESATMKRLPARI
jgi:hypothetical protein